MAFSFLVEFLRRKYSLVGHKHYRAIQQHFVLPFTFAFSTFTDHFALPCANKVCNVRVLGSEILTPAWCNKQY
jgi:hypothetical protein